MSNQQGQKVPVGEQRVQKSGVCKVLPDDDIYLNGNTRTNSY